MLIIGCDFHTRFQQIAMLDPTTGEMIERRLEHENGEAEKFYATLPSAAQVGMEATINLRDSEVHSDWCMSHRISTDALRKDSSVRTT